MPNVMYTEGHMSIVSFRPDPPVSFRSAYSISLKDEILDIKGWSTVMDARRQPIGDNMNVCSTQVGDKWISILHMEMYGDGGVYMFYDILPERGVGPR